MKLDDPADFTCGAERRERLQRLAQGLIERKEASRTQAKILGKLNYHVVKLKEQGRTSGPDIDSICGAIQEWADTGASLQSSRLVSALAPLEPLFVEASAPEPLAGVLGELRTASPGAQGARVGEVERTESPVPRARELVRGMRALLLGGEPEDARRDELVEALGLESGLWLPLDRSAPGAEVESAVATPDVDLICIVTRLPEDTYDVFKVGCRGRGVPFVRLSGGVSAPEVAQQILRQVGRMLQTRASMTAGA
jgi:hypothetical protein